MRVCVQLHACGAYRFKMLFVWSCSSPNRARIMTSTNRIQLRAAHTIASTTTSLIPDGGNSRWSLIQSEQQSEVDAELITVSRSDKGTNFYHYPRQGATRKDQDVCQTCKNYHSKRAMSRARFPLLASTPTWTEATTTCIGNHVHNSNLNRSYDYFSQMKKFWTIKL